MKKTVLMILILLLQQLICSCGSAAQSGSSLPSDPLSEGEYAVPVIRYGVLTSDSSLIGENTCTPAQLEEDVKALAESGFTPVFINDVIRYVKYDGDLPDRPVITVVDESKLYCMSELLPTAQKYNWRFSVCVSGSKTDSASEDADPDPERSYLCWEDISALRSSGSFEFTASAFDLLSDSERKNGGRKQGEDMRTYRRQFLGAVLGLRERCYDCCLFKPNAFIFPAGTVSDDFLTIAKECAFDAYITDENGVTAIKKGDSDRLLELKRIDRSGYYSTEDLLAEIG